MIFQMLSDFPVNGGALVIPAGATLEASLSNPEFRWNGSKVSVEPLPLTAMAMDQDAYDAMCGWYEEHLWHRFRYGPGVVPRRPRF